MTGKSGRGDTKPKRLGVYLPHELHTWIKVQAAIHETTMAAMVEKILWAHHTEVTQREAEGNSPSQIG